MSYSETVLRLLSNTSVYIIITLALVLDFLLYVFYGISLAGQLSDKILLWVWVLLTLIVVIRFIKSKWAKYYIGLLSSLILLLMLLESLPFGMSLSRLVDYATDTNGNYELRLDNYRFRDAHTYGFSTYNIIKVVENKGLYEVEIFDMDYGECSEDNNYTLADVDEINLTEDKFGKYFELVIKKTVHKRKLGRTRSFW